ncbi:hypothetical protein [Kangiella sp.]|uniref:hypothetical protein n=1 Tax=Kangiella sp. TaxID=1920245 RepID=UPI003A8D2D07
MKHQNRKVFYSKTEDNIFLPPTYVANLRKNLSPLEARRKLHGEWADDPKGIVYSEYTHDVHFIDADYEINPALPIFLSWDFNIGEGKPLSMCVGQYDEDADMFHFFEESVIDGARTNESCEDLAMRGVLDHDSLYLVTGDGTGHARSTKSLQSDYEIIEKYLANYVRPDGKNINFKMVQPRSNPPIKKRHNSVNAYLRNDLGDIRLFIYKGCKTLATGFRTTKLKKGGAYIEDDSNRYQHITTGGGYAICSIPRAIKSLYELDNFQING